MPNPITNREKEILSLSSQGKTAEVIGQLLGIKARTVVFHRLNICEKLEVTSIVQACCKAIRNGYIPLVILGIGVYLLKPEQEAEIVYMPPINTRPVANMCMDYDMDESFDEACTDGEVAVSGVPVCKELK